MPEPEPLTRPGWEPEPILESEPKPQQACIDCHFLAHVTYVDGKGYYYAGHSSSSPQPEVKHYDSFSRDDRSIIELTVNPDRVACAFGVWPVPLTRSQNKEDQVIQEAKFEERKDRCYFMPYEPGISIEAGKDLWKRHYEAKKELAARQIEDRREATQRAIEHSQSMLQQEAITQEAKRFAESHKLNEASYKLNETNKRLTTLLTIATVATTIAAIAQVVLAYLTYLASTRPPTP